MRYYLVDRNIDPEIIENLKSFGKIIYSGLIDNLYIPVNTHPDIQIHFLNSFSAVCCPELYEYYKNVLPESIKLFCGNNNAGGGYPNDASYNVAVFGNNIVCNTKYTEKIILDYYRKIGYNIINVNQGYTKCNICPVSENAIITEDIGIATELTKNNIDVCYINHGEVSLKNFDYGFIGGATGNLDNNILAFLGDIRYHSQFDKINSFLKKYKKDYVCLSKNKVFDYGSIIAF